MGAVFAGVSRYRTQTLHAGHMTAGAAMAMGKGSEHFVANGDVLSYQEFTYQQ